MREQTFALVTQTGEVHEIIPPYFNEAGDNVPIEARYHPSYVAMMVDITDTSPPPEPGWTFDRDVGAFAPPAAPVPSLAEKQDARDGRLAYAAAQIAPLQDAVDLAEATTAEVNRLKAWKQYRVELLRMDLTVSNPDWPAQPGA